MCSLVSLLLVSEDEVFLKEWSLGGECQQRRHFTYTSHHQQQVCCGTPELGNRFVPAPGPRTGEIRRRASDEINCSSTKSFVLEKLSLTK